MRLSLMCLVNLGSPVAVENRKENNRQGRRDKGLQDRSTQEYPACGSLHEPEQDEDAERTDARRGGDNGQSYPGLLRRVKPLPALSYEKGGQGSSETVVTQGPAHCSIQEKSCQRSDKQCLHTTSVNGPVRNQDQGQIKKVKQKEIMSRDHLGYDGKE